MVFDETSDENLVRSPIVIMKIETFLSIIDLFANSLSSIWEIYKGIQNNFPQRSPLSYL